MTNETGLETPADELAKASVTAVAPPPVRVRNLWMVLLGVLAALYALQWASPVLIPVMLGVMISYALSPLVNAMEKWHIHRAIGAAVLLICLVAGAGWLVFSLSDEAAGIIETLPDAAQKVRQAVRAKRDSGQSAIEKMQKAATEIEKAASDSGAPVAGTAPRGVTRVQIEEPMVNIRNFLWSGTLGALTFIGQLITVFFFAYFLMVAGDKFRLKLIKINHPQRSGKKVTAEALDAITKQIQRYLLVQLFTSTLVGVVSWLAFRCDRPGAMRRSWGIAAGARNSVPYFGSVVVSCGIASGRLRPVWHFGMALSAAGIALVITSLERIPAQPMAHRPQQRHNRRVRVRQRDVGGWNGTGGPAAGRSILMIIKTVCDHVWKISAGGRIARRLACNAEAKRVNDALAIDR